MKISSKSTKKEQQKSHNEKRRIGNLKGGEGEEPEAAAGQASRSSLEFLLNAKRNGSKLGTRGRRERERRDWRGGHRIRN